MFDPIEKNNFNAKYLRNHSVLSNGTHPTKFEEHLIEHQYLANSA